MTSEFIITELKKELKFLSDNYEVPLDTLNKLVEMLSDITEYICDPDKVTTPFSDDLGTEDSYCYPRELGEVHDTFNVVISNGTGNPITLTRRVIRSSQDNGSYLQSMVDVLSKLRNDK